MKFFSLILILSFLFSCAPIYCPDAESIKTLYSQSVSPKNYTALLSAKYGPLRIPVSVEKSNQYYNIRTLSSEILSYKDRNICIDSVCIDFPINPDGLIFGTVLEGNEKVSCSREGIVLEKDENLYVKKYIFFNGQLKSMEILDKRRNKTLVVNYGERTKEGYYKNLNLNIGNMDLRITIDEVKILQNN